MNLLFRRQSGDTCQSRMPCQHPDEEFATCRVLADRTGSDTAVLAFIIASHGLSSWRLLPSPTQLVAVLDGEAA